MTIELQEDSILLDDDFTLPFLNNWKKTLVEAKKYINDSFDGEKQKEITNKLNNFLKILVTYGNTTEDVVIKTAIYYYLIKEISFDFNISKESLSQPVKEGIEILTSNFEEGLKCKKYGYLNKIILSKLICDFENIDTLSQTTKIKLIAKTDKVLKDFNSNTHGKLLKILTEKRNSFK